MPGTQGTPSLRLPAIRRSRERLQIAKAGLAIFRQFHALCVPALSRGQALEAIAVYLTVEIGHIEGRPMTGTKIADYFGLPRVTVLRKLDQLLIEGTVIRIGDAYLLDRSRANSAETLAAVQRLIAALHILLREIEHASKMDTLLDDPSETDTDVLPTA